MESLLEADERLIKLVDIKLILSNHIINAYDEYKDAEEQYESGSISLDTLRSKRKQFETIQQVLSEVYNDIISK